MKQKITELEVPITPAVMDGSPFSGNDQIAATHVPGLVGPPSIEELLAERRCAEDGQRRREGNQTEERDEPTRSNPDEGSSGGDTYQKPQDSRHFVPKPKA